MKYLALSKQSLFIDGDWIESKDLSDSGIRYITTGNVGEGVYKEQGAGFITDAKFKELGCTEVIAGDLLVSRLNRPIGRACVVPDLGLRVVTSVDNVIVRADAQHVRAYLVYLFSSKEYFLHTDNLARGTTMQRVSRGQLGNIRIVVPPSNEQTQIAGFLDYETRRIDRLIDKQQQLIALLKEKRQAVISHAVTKGLNPNAPMKDSGVEWLGQVPEHWTVMAIKRLVSIPVTDGPHETPEFVDSGVPFLSAEGVSSGQIDFSRVRGFISEEADLKYSKKYSPLRHDIFMVKSGATTGITALVETDEKFNIWSPLAVIRCSGKADPYFTLNFMRSREFQEAIELNWSFGTQQNIGMGVIENLAIACPPVAEAKAIADSIRVSSASFKSIIAKAKKQIDLLQERRTALISAAVTGKIDVRSWTPPDSDEEALEAA